jgi:hypothetical protein
MASALHGAEEYALHDTADGSVLDHSPFTNHETLEHVHLASLAEKKRLWWRNALINTLFIASWCVLYPFLCCLCCSSCVPGTYASNLQVHIRNHPITVQQMDVLSRAFRIPIPPLRHYITHVCAVRAGGRLQGHLAETV